MKYYIILYRRFSKKTKRWSGWKAFRILSTSLDQATKRAAFSFTDCQTNIKSIELTDDPCHSNSDY